MPDKVPDDAEAQAAYESRRAAKARANAAARAELDRRGHRGPNPRILEARAKGANV